MMCYELRFNIGIKRISLATIRILLCICMLGVFQQAKAQHHGNVAKEDTLQEVLVHGVMPGRDYRSTAPKFTLTQTSMDRLGVTDISSALNRLPGITLQDYGGAGGLKTVSVRGFGSQHTAVVYDGVSLSNYQSGRIDVSRYSLDNVANMALVVGDNDDIFQPARNSAAAAALHISTLKIPTNDLSTHVTSQLKLGSWDYTNPYVRLEKNFSNMFGISVVGDYIYALNNYPYTIDNVDHKESGRRENSKMNSAHAELSFIYKPQEKHTLSLKTYFYDNNRQLPGMVHYYVNDSQEHMHDQNAFGQFNWKALFSEKWQMAWVAKFNYTMTDYKNPSYPHGVKDHQYWQREYYVSGSLLYNLSDHLSFSYAADYSFNNLTGGDVSTYRSPLRHTILQNLAAKYQTERVTVIARLLESLYYNKATIGESAKDINHLSPSLSVNYKVLADKELYVRLAYKDIFRSPTFNESYYEHYGSTDLNPERTHQVNLGVTWAHEYGYGSQLSITADGYMNVVKDKIIAIPYDMFKWTNVNLGSVHTKGLDLTLNLSHHLNQKHSLIFAGNYTLQKVQDRTDGPSSPYYNLQVAYTPVYSGSASLAWENPWVNFSANAVMVSSRWPNNEHYQGTMLPGYTTIGLTAYRSFNVWKHDLYLRFDIKNLFNEQYEIVGNYPMPGRSWHFTIRYKF